MKKMFKVFGIIAVVLCLFISVVACDNSDKSVEVVAISQSEYSTVEDAMKGYVSEELAYSATSYNGEEKEVVTAQYVSHESKGEVSVKLTEEQKVDFVSAEKIAVKAKVALKSLDENTSSEVTQTVYALKYGEKYKYMVSVPEVGERLTNSYLSVLMDTSKYTNCTISGDLKSKEEDEEEASFERGVEYKLTNDAIFSCFYVDETRYNSRTPGKDDDGNFDVRSYVLAKEESIVTVMYTYLLGQESWIASAPIETNMEKYSASVINSQIFAIFGEVPAAMYTKTAKGCSFKYGVTENDETETIEYAVTISDGKMVGFDISNVTSWTDEEDGTVYTESYEQKVVIDSFGSTTITIPNEVTNAAK